MIMAKGNDCVRIEVRIFCSFFFISKVCFFFTMFSLFYYLPKNTLLVTLVDCHSNSGGHYITFLKFEWNAVSLVYESVKDIF